jgi:hypothetical protein
MAAFLLTFCNAAELQSHIPVPAANMTITYGFANDIKLLRVQCKNRTWELKRKGEDDEGSPSPTSLYRMARGRPAPPPTTPPAPPPVAATADRSGGGGGPRLSRSRLSLQSPPFSLPPPTSARPLASTCRCSSAGRWGRIGPPPRRIRGSPGRICCCRPLSWPAGMLCLRGGSVGWGAWLCHHHRPLQPCRPTWSALHRGVGLLHLRGFGWVRVRGCAATAARSGLATPAGRLCARGVGLLCLRGSVGQGRVAAPPLPLAPALPPHLPVLRPWCGRAVPLCSVGRGRSPRDGSPALAPPSDGCTFLWGLVPAFFVLGCRGRPAFLQLGWLAWPRWLPSAP